jgi:hypothetical protein
VLFGSVDPIKCIAHPAKTPTIRWLIPDVHLFLVIIAFCCLPLPKLLPLLIACHSFFDGCTGENCRIATDSANAEGLSKKFAAYTILHYNSKNNNGEYNRWQSHQKRKVRSNGVLDE